MNGNPNIIGNGYSGQRNNPNSGQQNPNVVIQSGQTHPGALQPTVHVNLNTLPMTDHQYGNTQPQTVNVNLNTYPPSPGRQEINTFSAPETHTLPQNNMNTVARHNRNNHRDSLIQTDHSHVNHAFQPDVDETRQLPPYSHETPRSLRRDPHLYNDFAQAHQSRPTDVTYAGHHSASRRPSTDFNLRQSNHERTRSRTRDNDHPSDSHRDARDPVEATARHQQRPWDTLRGTPAYPNQEAHPSRWSGSSSASTESQSSGHQPRPSQTAPSSGQAAQTPSGTRREARAGEGDTQRANDRRANDQREEDSPAFMDPNARRRRGQQGLSSSQPHVSRQTEQNPPQRQAVPPSPATAAQANASHMANTTTRSTAPHMPTVPQNIAVQPHSNPQKRQHPPYGTQVRQADRSPQTRSQALAQTVPEQRQAATQATNAQAPVQTGRNQNQPSPLTQASLQHHASHTNNPFANRNQQTQAALQNPGPQARPQQPRTQTAQPSTQPPPATQKANGSARHPPTPPPVLHPHQFQSLPRERTQQHRQQQARPVAVPFPGTVPVGHGPPGATHRPPRHVPTHAHTQAHRHPANAPQHAHRHTADAHLHANLQRHAIAHKPPPAHVRQVREFGV